MKMIRALATLAVLAATALPATATTTTAVVDVPAATGGMQRFLYVRPDAPIATLVQLPGGDGISAFQADGSSSTRVGECNPFTRSRDALAAAGIAVAVVDATTNGFVRDPADIQRVVNHVRARDNVPVWVAGGSASTSTAELMARTLSGEVGVVFYSPMRPSTGAATIRRPALVVYHPADSDQFGNTMYNALTSAVVRERVTIATGTSQGCGYHLFEGALPEFAAVVASFITRHNAATRAAGANYQGLWWKSPGGSESGWGVNLAHQGDTLFATWFTYDTDGRGMWLVMPSGTRGAGETFTGALYRTTGPAFSATPFDPARIAATEVGAATFTFGGAGEGTFAYVVNGLAQAKPITRQIYASPVPECGPAGAAGNAVNYQALWWAAPAGVESGWGLNVTHQGDILFATWFTYDADGRGMWLVMPSMARTSPGTYSGAIYRTTGPAFDAQPWLGSGVQATEMGSATLAFADAERGTFSYTVAGLTQSKAIVRQVFGTPATVCG